MMVWSVTVNNFGGDQDNLHFAGLERGSFVDRSFVDRLEWTPRLRQRVRGTVVVGCCGLYSSKVKREALQNRRSGHELCWRATHEGIAG